MNKQANEEYELANPEEDFMAAPPVDAPVARTRQNTRVKLFSIFALVILLVAGSGSLYWWLIGSRYVSTDNAYVQAEVAQVTPSVGGIIKEVLVTDTQAVQQGDVIVVIDDTDMKLALAQAEAELGRAERRVQGYFASDEGLSAQVTAREAEQSRAAAQIASAEADYKRAEIDLQRRKALSKSGSVSGEELSTAQNAFATAQANLAAAKAAQAEAQANREAAVGSLNTNTVLTANTTVATNPEVALAKARVDQARVDLERTVIRAPVSGIIARRQVQLGQRVEAGSPLMAVVPLMGVHVDANFKEVQLRKVRPGQTVELVSDLYGSDVVYHGVVAGFSGGTGSAFALIPAQNATGNWIKVVQRLPVRITLDPKELEKHPLQVGLSMEATIKFDGKK